MKIEMNENPQDVILGILRATGETLRYHAADDLAESILQGIDGTKSDGASWILSRDARMALAQKAVELGIDLEDVIDLLTWKDFEGFVAHILSEHGFRCIESFRRRGTELSRGMEIDVIGIRGNAIVSADAKMWGIRKSKSSALRAAAENQKERSMKLVSIMSKVAERLGPLSLKRYEVYPMLVTWFVEEVQFHEGVPIVPVFKLNSFILGFDSFQDLMVYYPYERIEQ